MPAKSMRPSSAGSPTRNTCIFTTSPIVRPLALIDSSIRCSTDSVCASVSPQYSRLYCSASGFAGPGTMPLW
jgi:hypothetical protein